MRIPGGILIPDGPEGGIGCLGSLLIGLFVLAMLEDTCNNRGRRATESVSGAPTTLSAPSGPRSPEPPPERKEAASIGRCAPEQMWSTLVDFIERARSEAAEAPARGEYETTSEFELRRREWDTAFLHRLNSLGAQVGPIQLDLDIERHEYDPDSERLNLSAVEQVALPMTGGVYALSCDVQPLLRCDYAITRRDAFITAEYSAAVKVPLDVARQIDIAHRKLSLRTQLYLGVTALVGGGVARFAPGIKATDAVVLDEGGQVIVEAVPLNRPFFYEVNLFTYEPPEPPSGPPRLPDRWVFRLDGVAKFTDQDAGRRCY